MNGHPIDPFLAAWSSASGIDGFASRLRVYDALRLPGRWNRNRLRAVLAAVLVPTPDLHPLFVQLFDDCFQDDALDAKLDGLDIERALRTLSDAAGQRVDPDPPPPVDPVKKETRKVPPARWGQRAALLIGLIVAVLLVAKFVPTHRTHDHTSSSAPSDAGGAKQAQPVPTQAPVPEPPKEYQLEVKQTPVPAPSWNGTYLAIAATLLFLAAMIELLHAERRRRFLTPEIPTLEVEDASELRLEGARPLPLSAADLDRLAFRTGLALDFDAVRLNVRETVRRAANQAGFVTAMYDPRKQTRGVSVVLPTIIDETASIVATSFVDGLRRRGVPVQVTTGAPRWDTEDLVLVALDARNPSDPPVERWMTLPNVALLEVRDPALWAAEVSALPRRVHALDRDGLYQALDVAASGRNPRPEARSDRGFPGGAFDVSQLGNAFPLAAACALIAPCDFGTADQLRRELLPSIPFLAFQRVRLLRGVTLEPTGWRFSPGLTRKLQDRMTAEFATRILDWQATRLASLSFPAGSRAATILARERALIDLKRKLLAADLDPPRPPTEAEILEPLRELERQQGDDSLGRRAKERLVSIPAAWLVRPSVPNVVRWRLFRLTGNAEQRPEGLDPATRPRFLSVIDALAAAAMIALVVAARPPASTPEIAGISAQAPVSGVWLYQPGKSLLSVIEGQPSGKVPAPLDPGTFTVMGIFPSSPPESSAVAWSGTESVSLSVGAKETTKASEWICRLPRPAASKLKGSSHQIALLSFPRGTAYDLLAERVLNEGVADCYTFEQTTSIPNHNDALVLAHRVEATAPDAVAEELRKAGFPALSNAPSEAKKDEPKKDEPKKKDNGSGSRSICVVLDPVTGTCRAWSGKGGTAPPSTTCRTQGACESEGLCTLVNGTCRAVGNDCKASSYCRYSGACTAVSGACQAVGDDCLSSSTCLDSGNCVAGPYGCRAKSDEQCRKSSACANNGLCIVKDDRCVATNADCRASVYCKADGMCTESGGRCVASSEADCKAATDCERYGECSLGSIAQQVQVAQSPSCVAKSDGDCAGSEVCKGGGKCTAQNGRCAIGKDADCARSAKCTQSGLCTAQNGACVASSDEACRKASDCALGGYCTASAGKCIATLDTDCAASKACKYSAECSASKGQCVATTKSCQSGAPCKEDGLCSAVNGGCAAARDSDCAAAPVCKSYGACSARAGRCVPTTTAHCRASDACTRDGECILRDGKCAPASTKDCAASVTCKGAGLCVAEGGRCSAVNDSDCMASDVCKQDGRCGARGGACIATSDWFCQKSASCPQSGACAARDGKCVAIADADCKASQDCKDTGVCAAVNGSCQATTDAMCVTTNACKSFGGCVAQGGRCVPTSDAMCRTSDACPHSGNCVLGKSACAAASDDDCKKSRMCTFAGWCAAIDGRCQPRNDADCATSTECQQTGECTASRGFCVKSPAKK